MLGGALTFGRQGGVAVAGKVVPEALEPPAPGVLLVGEVEPDVETRRESLIARQPRVVGTGRRPGIDALVGIAEHGRRVSCSPGRPGHVVETEVERGPVADHPVVELIRPGVETRPSGATRGRLAVVPGQTHACARQAVEVGRLHDRMPGNGETVGTELVERDEENVHR